MREVKPLAIRSCPVCRVAMVRADTAWHCPACGSTILDAPARPQPQRRDEPHETAVPARVAAALRA